MSCQEFVRAANFTALRALAELQNCLWDAQIEAVEVHGLRGIEIVRYALEKCRDKAADYHTASHIAHHEVFIFCKFFGKWFDQSGFKPNPEDTYPPRPWPWPWPPIDWSSTTIQDLLNRVRVVEDAVILLADFATQPAGLDQVGIGSVLSDPELHLEAATSVQEFLDGAGAGISEEIERIQNLRN